MSGLQQDEKIAFQRVSQKAQFQTNRMIACVLETMEIPQCDNVRLDEVFERVTAVWRDRETEDIVDYAMKSLTVPEAATDDIKEYN